MGVCWRSPPPVANPIAGDFPGVRLVCLDFTQGVVPVVLNELQIHCADKDIFVIEKTGHRLVVPSDVFYDRRISPSKLFK